MSEKLSQDNLAVQVWDIGRLRAMICFGARGRNRLETLGFQGVVVVVLGAKEQSYISSEAGCQCHSNNTYCWIGWFRVGLACPTKPMPLDRSQVGVVQYSSTRSRQKLFDIKGRKFVWGLGYP